MQERGHIHSLPTSRRRKWHGTARDGKSVVRCCCVPSCGLFETRPDCFARLIVSTRLRIIENASHWCWQKMQWYCAGRCFPFPSSFVRVCLLASMYSTRNTIQRHERRWTSSIRFARKIFSQVDEMEAPIDRSFGSFGSILPPSSAGFATGSRAAMDGVNQVVLGMPNFSGKSRARIVSHVVCRKVPRGREFPAVRITCPVRRFALAFPACWNSIVYGYGHRY